MNRYAIFTGIAGAMILSAFAGNANAQSRIYPDAAGCSQLSDAELVACQNQVYAQQLQSGISHMANPPETVVPSSNIDGREIDQSSGYVGGAETDIFPTQTTIYGTYGAEGYYPDNNSTAN